MFDTIIGATGDDRVGRWGRLTGRGRGRGKRRWSIVPMVLWTPFSSGTEKNAEEFTPAEDAHGAQGGESTAEFESFGSAATGSRPCSGVIAFALAFLFLL